MLAQATAIFNEHRRVADECARLLPHLVEVAAQIANCLKYGGKLLVFGNGGSAADAQHLAGEFVGRFTMERPPLPAVALSANAPALTCIANDYDFTECYSRQVTALARRGDIVIGISTSGHSENVIRGIIAATQRQAVTVALSGSTGGRLAELATYAIIVPATVTARIQEMHILIIHTICQLVEEQLGSDGTI